MNESRNLSLNPVSYVSSGSANSIFTSSLENTDLGFIGEFFSVSIEEKKKLISCAANYIGGRVKLIAGTTSMELEETIYLSRYAKQKGIDDVIILPPYYFTLSADRIEQYYDVIAKCLPDQRIYFYNFPDRTGYTIPVEVTLKLLRKYKNFVGYKDTQAGMAHTLQLIKAVKPEFPDFEIYAGFDDNFAHNVLSGGDGCIAGLSNIVPQLCHSWVQAFANENLSEVQRIQKTINGLMEIYQVGEPFIPYIKAAMEAHGQGEAGISSFPLLEANKDEKQALAQILNKWLDC